MWSHVLNRFKNYPNFLPNYYNGRLLLRKEIVNFKKHPNVSYSKLITSKYLLEKSLVSSVKCLTNIHVQRILNLAHQRFKNNYLYDRIRLLHFDAKNTTKTLENEPNSIEDKNTEIQNKVDDPQIKSEFQNIVNAFPQPKNILDSYQGMLDKKIYDIYYKQNVTKHHGKSKISPNHLSWICTVKFNWPDYNVFEGDGLNKSKASIKALHKALYWLYSNKKIDLSGRPIHSMKEIREVSKDLNPPLYIDLNINNTSEIKEINKRFYKEIEPLLNLKTRQVEDTDLLTDINSEFHDGSLNQYIDPIFGIASENKNTKKMNLRSKYLISNLKNRSTELKLPVFDYKQKIIDLVEAHRAIVIRGATGCGKSTFVPSFLLDNWIQQGKGADCNILVAEPRRVAALTLAERVAELRGEELGDVCGYQVRLSTCLTKTPGGSILYCTAGTLLRRLAVSPDLPGCTYLILDEAHERSADIDAVMTLSKTALKLNPKLKIIVMSATIDTELFSKYFDNCPILDIPGFMYDVKSYFLEDLPHDLSSKLKSAWLLSDDQKSYLDPLDVCNVIKWIDNSKPEGAILVFLPGWNEIKHVKYQLEYYFGNSMDYLILPIHSKLSNDDQRKIFQKASPNVRKIILATNIAETSITINDVLYVVDTGLHKELKLMDSKGISSLDHCWISKANVKQRKGRAGRVKPGECIHLYTKKKMNSFGENPIPEIMRVPLEKIVLDCKTYSQGESAIDFLNRFPQPPTENAVQTAIQDLVDIGAIDEEENLTALGKRIVSFTTHPKLSKTLIYSTIFNVLSPILDIVTILSNNIDIFNISADNKEDIREFKKQYHPTSDHQSLYWLLQHCNTMKQEDYAHSKHFCNLYNIRREKLNLISSIREIYVNHLQQCKMLPDYEDQDIKTFPGKDYNSNDDELVKGVLYSGLNTLLNIKNSVKVYGKLSKIKLLSTDIGQNGFITPESVNHHIEKKISSGAILYCGAIHSKERRGVLVRDTSLISPLTVFMFSSNIQKLFENNEKVVFKIDGKKIKLECSKENAAALLSFRKAIWTLVDFYVKYDGLESTVINSNCQELELKNLKTFVDDFKGDAMNCLSKILTNAEIEINKTIK